MRGDEQESAFGPPRPGYSDRTHEQLEGLVADRPFGGSHNTDAQGVIAEPIRPRTRPRLWRDLLVGLGVFGIYLLVAALPASGRRPLADRNARAVLAFEQWLHVDVEKALNTWLAGRPVLMVIANYEYAYVYVIGAFGLLFWMYFRRPDGYPVARDSFIALNLIAIGCFALFPLTPPRLLPALGYVDTVAEGATFGSWGSPLIPHANELAAMPSLHVAWALWISVILARGGHAVAFQVVAAVHVAVTVVVIAATATHFLADAIPAIPLVWVSVALAERLCGPRGSVPASRLAAADAFFVAVDSAATPQQLGALVVIDHDATDAAAYRDRLTTVIQAHLDQLPRFQQRIVSPESRWQRPRWAPTTEMDWHWHVGLRDLTDTANCPSDTSALNSLVAELASTPLPMQRPPWRFVVATGFAPGKLAAILIVHHAVADGLQILAQMGALLQPPAGVAPPVGDRPGLLPRAMGTVIGLAQLATDGRNHYLLASGSNLQFGAFGVPLATLCDAARTHRVHVTDVLLSAMAGALSQLLDPAPPTVRVEVPLTMRAAAAHRGGNATGAVMIELPLNRIPESDRLAKIGTRSRRLSSGTRGLGSIFVTGAVCEMLPAPVLSRFARTVYGHRFFQAILSNMPGRAGTHRLAGAPITAVYPIVPLAPRGPACSGLA